MRFAGIAVCSVVLVGCTSTTQAHEAATSSAALTPTASALATPLVSPALASISPTPVDLPPSTFTATTASSASPPAIAAGDLVQLATLPIKGRAPMTGYSRAQFGPAWPTENGCDGRNEALRRDLTQITLQGNCTVETGTLVSPYTGGTINFVRGPNSAIVQIDHVVALGNAWQTGAQSWPTAKRDTFGNDLLELLAVDGPSNDQKGDADAASWLPSNKAFRCEYVGIQVAVKVKYGLWVTQAEHDAIARILATCGVTTTPGPAVVVVAPTPTATAAHTVAPKPVPSPTTPAPANGVPIGATALCRDGTYSFAAHHQGSCSHHGGVAQFYS